MELLTVIAIIAILATLLSTAVTSAKRKARQARCTGNLHQISLALGMYLDDETVRPTNLTELVTRNYLPARGALLCPEDKTGNWGGLVDGNATGLTSMNAPSFGASDNTKSNQRQSDLIPYSYLSPLFYDNTTWDKLVKRDSSAGIATCQVHGLGKPNLEYPTVYDYQGLILRGQRDGSVVRRQVFWTQTTDQASKPSSSLVPSAPAAADTTTGAPWQLFADEPLQ